MGDPMTRADGGARGAVEPTQVTGSDRTVNGFCMQ